MAVTVLAPSNTQRLTTLDAVKAEVPLQDHLLFAESVMDQASMAIARELGTVVGQQHYEEIQRAWYQTTTLHLRYWPLYAVTGIEVDGEPIDGWRLESQLSGTLYRRAGWYFHGADLGIQYVSGYILPEQVLPFDPLGPTLRTVASDLERATLETIKVWFHERMVGERVESRRLGDQSIDYGVQARRTGIPVLAKDLLQPWRRLRVA